MQLPVISKYQQVPALVLQFCVMEDLGLGFAQSRAALEQ